MPLVSVIVPCYNSTAVLDDTLRSLTLQRLGDWEAIAVDDGSTDDTWGVIERWQRTDRRIRGRRVPNGGTSRARNHGVTKASPDSRCLWFLDHDDQLREDALLEMTVYLERHPEVGLASCGFEDVAADGRRLGSRRRSRWVPGWPLPRELRDDEPRTPFVSFFYATDQGPFALYRRSVYAQTAGWDERIWPHEDTDMVCQMGLLAPVHFVAERYYLKRIHPSKGMNDAPRVQQAYGVIRRKWDTIDLADDAQRRVVAAARRHYDGTPLPLRWLKVGAKALAEFTRRPSWSSLGCSAC